MLSGPRQIRVLATCKKRKSEGRVNLGVERRKSKVRVRNAKHGGRSSSAGLYKLRLLGARISGEGDRISNGKGGGEEKRKCEEKEVQEKGNIDFTTFNTMAGS